VNPPHIIRFTSNGTSADYDQLPGRELRQSCRCASLSGSSSSATNVLALTAALSAVGPAWRAVRIDPAVALRSE
jgi:hypothetical protein